MTYENLLLDAAISTHDFNNAELDEPAEPAMDLF
jgi:hypothetical protein